MRYWILYIAILTLVIVDLAFVSGTNSSPEKLIIGTWIEREWVYEKVDDFSKNEDKYKRIKQEVKDKIGENLIIHQAETWDFKPNGELILTGKEGLEQKIVNWRIKGRGNILKLRYKNEEVEHYEIVELGENKMVLNFETDVEIRGIAKLTFSR